MPTRHSLLAELEGKRRKEPEEPVGVLSRELHETAGTDQAGYNPCHNAADGITPAAGRAPAARATGKRR